jgi:Periplasmic protease
VGRRSFGKGLVQEQFAFTDESGLRLTVARFYTPSGRCIQKPYEDYDYDIYKRYTDGEIFSADSVKLNKEDVHHTRGGRIVYGGGGIMPDVFVPMDTTRASTFYVDCNRKTTQMRFAAAMFDRYAAQLRTIDNYRDMDAFLKRIDIPGEFRRFALTRDGISVKDDEFKERCLTCSRSSTRSWPAIRSWARTPSTSITCPWTPRWRKPLSPSGNDDYAHGLHGKRKDDGRESPRRLSRLPVYGPR